jgi:hypothetical protein
MIKDTRTPTLRKWHNQLTEICDAILPKQEYAQRHTHDGIVWSNANVVRLAIYSELQKRGKHDNLGTRANARNS